MPGSLGMSGVEGTFRGLIFVVREKVLFYDKFSRFFCRFSRFQPVLEFRDAFHQMIAAISENAVVASTSHG